LFTTFFLLGVVTTVVLSLAALAAWALAGYESALRLSANVNANKNGTLWREGRMVDSLEFIRKFDVMARFCGMV
jgi:hypothetical protein